MGAALKVQSPCNVMQMANAPANPALMGSSVMNVRQITTDILLAKVCTVQSIFMDVRSTFLKESSL